jgi:hypothetical protein
MVDLPTEVSGFGVPTMWHGSAAEPWFWWGISYSLRLPYDPMIVVRGQHEVGAPGLYSQRTEITPREDLWMEGSLLRAFVAPRTRGRIWVQPVGPTRRWLESGVVLRRRGWHSDPLVDAEAPKGLVWEGELGQRGREFMGRRICFGPETLFLFSISFLNSKFHILNSICIFL